MCSSDLCARCARPLIGRDWYAITRFDVRVEDGAASCPGCGEPLPGRFVGPVETRAGFRRLRVTAP